MANFFRDVREAMFLRLRKVRAFLPDVVRLDSAAVYDLLCINNHFGLVFVGEGSGFMVAKSSDLYQDLTDVKLAKLERNDVPMRHYRLPAGFDAIGRMAVNCDGSLLAVVARRGDSQFCLVYDVRVFSESFPESNAGPFSEVRLTPGGGNPGQAVAIIMDFHWNPAVANMFGAICSDGTGMLCQIGDSSFQIAASFGGGSSCCCWSPKGKQIVVGHVDGSLKQLKPNGQIAKSIPGPPNLPGMLACRVLWLSTTQFGVVYYSTSEQRLQFYIVTVSKESPVNYQSYDDICFGFCADPKQMPSYYLLHIPEWNVILCSSTISVDTAVLGLAADGKSWELWNLDDTVRAELPVDTHGVETYPLGVALDRTICKQIPINEVQSVGNMPVLVLLTTAGVLCPFYFINRLAGDVGMARPATSLPAGNGARVAMLPAPPTPPTQQPSAEQDAGVHGFSSSPPVSAPAKQIVQSLAASATPATAAPAATTPGASVNPVALPVTPVPNNLGANGVNSFSHANGFGSSQMDRPSAGVPLGGVAACDVTATVSSENSAKFERSKADQIRDIYGEALHAEIASFSKEMADVKMLIANPLPPIGSKDELLKLANNTSKMEDQWAPLKEDSEILHETMDNLKVSLFDTLSSIEEAKMHVERRKQPEYRALMRAWPLDPQKEKQLQSLTKQFEELKSIFDDLKVAHNAYLRRKREKKRSNGNADEETMTLSLIYRSISNIQEIIAEQRKRVNKLNLRLALVDENSYRKYFSPSTGIARSPLSAKLGSGQPTMTSLEAFHRLRISSGNKTSAAASPQSPFQGYSPLYGTRKSETDATRDDLAARQLSSRLKESVFSGQSQIKRIAAKRLNLLTRVQLDTQTRVNAVKGGETPSQQQLTSTPKHNAAVLMDDDRVLAGKAGSTSERKPKPGTTGSTNSVLFSTSNLKNSPSPLGLGDIPGGNGPKIQTEVVGSTSLPFSPPPTPTRSSSIAAASAYIGTKISEPVPNLSSKTERDVETDGDHLPGKIGKTSDSGGNLEFGKFIKTETAVSSTAGIFAKFSPAQDSNRSTSTGIFGKATEPFSTTGIFAKFGPTTVVSASKDGIPKNSSTSSPSDSKSESVISGFSFKPPASPPAAPTAAIIPATFGNPTATNNLSFAASPTYPISTGALPQIASTEPVKPTLKVTPNLNPKVTLTAGVASQPLATASNANTGVATIFGSPAAAPTVSVSGIPSASVSGSAPATSADSGGRVASEAVVAGSSIASSTSASSTSSITATSFPPSTLTMTSVAVSATNSEAAPIALAPPVSSTLVSSNSVGLPSASSVDPSRAIPCSSVAAVSGATVAPPAVVSPATVTQMPEAVSTSQPGQLAGISTTVMPNSLTVENTAVAPDAFPTAQLNDESSMDDVEAANGSTPALAGFSFRNAATPPPGSGMFGGGSPSGAGEVSPSGFGSFGAGSGSSFGGFGTAATTAATSTATGTFGGGFGGGSIFGSPTGSAATSPVGSNAGTSLFGGGSGFGSLGLGSASVSTTPKKNVFGGFGSTSPLGGGTAQQQAVPSGLFGSHVSSGFGGSATFGGSPPGGASTGGFGSFGGGSPSQGQPNAFAPAASGGTGATGAFGSPPSFGGTAVFGSGSPSAGGFGGQASFGGSSVFGGGGAASGSSGFGGAGGFSGAASFGGGASAFGGASAGSTPTQGSIFGGSGGATGGFAGFAQAASPTFGSLAGSSSPASAGFGGIAGQQQTTPQQSFGSFGAFGGGTTSPQSSSPASFSQWRS